MREIRRVEAASGNGASNSLAPAVKLFLAASKPVEELYDTTADPHELNNLAADQSHRETLLAMRAVHMQWILDTKDTGLIPEPELAAREGSLGSRYAILRQPGAETLMERVRDAAALSLRGAESLPSLTKATFDDDAAVRYWGAIGIGNLGAHAMSAEQRVRQLLADSSAVVRVAAARALCRMKKPENALPVLVRVLEDGEQWERLHAIIALDEIDEMARPVIDKMQAALEYRNDLVANGKYTVRVANRALNEIQGTNNEVK